MMLKETWYFIISIAALTALAYMLPRGEVDEPSTLEPELKQIASMYILSRDRDSFVFEEFRDRVETLAKTVRNPEQINISLTLMAILEGEDPKITKADESSNPRWRFLDFLLETDPDLPEDISWVNRQSWLDVALLHKCYEQAGLDRETVELSVELRFLEQGLRDSARIASFFEIMSLLGLALIIQTFFQWTTFKKMKWDLFSLAPIKRPLKQLVHFLALFFVLFILVEQLSSTLQMGIWSFFFGYIISILIAWVLLQKFLFTRFEMLFFGGLSTIRMTLPIFLTSVFGFCVLLFMSKMMIFLLHQIHWPFQSVANERAIQELMSSPVSATVLILVSCLIAPICEELLFRGLILNTMASSMSKGHALLWSSLVFALFHPISFFPVIFILGFCLGLVYMRGRNLMAPILTHVFWNLFTLVFIQLG